MESGLKEITHPKFAKGQQWTYRTRPGEESSSVIIGRLEMEADGSIIVHASLIDLHLKLYSENRIFSRSAGHFPISLQAFEQSIVELLSENVVHKPFTEGYEYWRNEYQKDSAGVFSRTIAEIVQYIEETRNSS